MFPTVYFMKKDMIHSILDNVQTQVNQTFDIVFKNIPKYADLKEE